MNQHYNDENDDQFDDEFQTEADYEAAGAYGDKDEYGYCPLCGSPGEVVGAGVRQWVVCHRDKVKWRLGLGFFGLFQRREKWDQTPRDIAAYREVKPLREPKETPSPNDEEARFRRMMGE
jgi:hypothetical protein